MQAVADLLPHQPPMRLIESVLANDAHEIWATSAIDSSFPFAGPRGLRACFGLEMVAQAAAAFLTLIGNDDGLPRPGMLIACRQFDSTVAHYPSNCRLLIHARLDSRLPSDATGPALVKFSGDVTVFQASSAMPTEVDELLRQHNSTVDTKVSLSVYL